MLKKRKHRYTETINDVTYVIFTDKDMTVEEITELIENRKDGFKPGSMGYPDGPFTIEY